MQSLAEIIDNNKREEDIVARYGGDEFVMLLPDTKKEDALGFAERFRVMVESRKFTFNGLFLPITISGGVATFPDDAKDVVKLIHCADHALHVAKREGKNLILVYKKDVRKKDVRKFVRLPYFEKINGTTLSDGKNVVLLAKSKNIGVGVILLENKFPVHVGALDEISVVLAGKAVTIRGEVVRTDPQKTDRFDLGVSFLEKQESAKIVLDNYVLNSLLQSENSCQ